jgi:sugar phosphate isomerase/epimerase
MLIGAMNHPTRDVTGEIAWMADLGLGFIDLTLEPPAAASWAVNPAEIRRALEKRGLGVVGHTAFYLPIASAVEELRRAGVEDLRRSMRVFAELGARWMNLHPDHFTPMHDRSFFVKRNLQSIQELLPEAQRLGIGLMIENLPGNFNTPEQLGELLEPLPELGLHLDIGHANLMLPANSTERILERYGGRVRHVHLHDNNGGSADLHLPLGAGNLDLPRMLGALKRCYDHTITLEVFTPDRHYFEYSVDVLRRVWNRV